MEALHPPLSAVAWQSITLVARSRLLSLRACVLMTLRFARPLGPQLLHVLTSYNSYYCLCFLGDVYDTGQLYDAYLSRP